MRPVSEDLITGTDICYSLITGTTDNINDGSVLIKVSH